MRILVHDIRIFVKKKGSGHPLVLLHGNGEDHHIFDELVDRLSQHYTCYMVDSRNHGSSDKTDVFDYAIMASDLCCLMTKLHLVQPYFLGFSDGGIVGLLAAIETKNVFKKMVICGANLEPKGLKKTVLQEMQTSYERHQSPYLRLMLEQPHIDINDLKKMDIPTMIIAGDHDVIQKRHTEKMHHHIPHAQLIILKNKHHDDYLVHRDDLYDDLMAFFREDRVPE